MYRNDGTSQKGNCIEMSGTEGVVKFKREDTFVIRREH